MARLRARQPAPGFTIIELLVVLAIIAILTALLLPSLSIARNQASRTKCLNNIRQIGMAIAVYVHDYNELPPPEQTANTTSAVKTDDSIYYSERRGGLLALRQNTGFNRYYLTCPEGWASGGDETWYEAKGLSRTGSAYMDYAYWARRYPPVEDFDVRPASFTYRRTDKATKILVTDCVADQGTTSKTTTTIGDGNHGSNHAGPPAKVLRTDGRGHRLSAANLIRSSGGAALFSDYHAQWFKPEKWTQQTDGLCFPPVDQW